MVMRGLVILIMLSSMALFAGEKIVPIVTEYKVDTLVYESDAVKDDKHRNRLKSALHNAKIYPVPLIDAAQSNYYTLIGRACLKKNSSQIDIVSFQGVIGTVNIPSLLDTTLYLLTFSRTFIDNDPGWEVLAVFYKPLNGSTIIQFTLYDDDGSIVISEEGNAYLGFDGNSTFVVTGYPSNLTFKSWRFRTNISPSGGSTLKKTTSGIAPIMMTYGMSDGNYRVTLEPTSGGKTRMQLFDLVGRCIFSKQIDNISQLVSFTIPESSLPQTPFITKVSNSNGSVVKKEILVK
jgi:hypothetical protein